mgnify:CR=1 FL=1
MKGRGIKLTNIESPCYNRETHTDCPNRYVGCRQSCQAWEIYQAQKDALADKKIKEHNKETDIVLYDILSKLKSKRRRSGK